MNPDAAALVASGKSLTDDDFDLIGAAHPHIDALPSELFATDITALVALRPAKGDTANGPNWSVLHAIETSSAWPLWDLLDDPDHEWQNILRTRLKNGGYAPRGRPLCRRLFGA